MVAQSAHPLLLPCNLLLSYVNVGGYSHLNGSSTVWSVSVLQTALCNAAILALAIVSLLKTAAPKEPNFAKEIPQPMATLFLDLRPNPKAHLHPLRLSAAAMVPALALTKTPESTFQ